MRYREPATGLDRPGPGRRLPRCISPLTVLGLLAIASAQAPGPRPESGRLDVVATGIPRPAQLAVDGSTLIALGPGLRGDVAGEIYQVDLDLPLPADLTLHAAHRLAFSHGRTATLGSLALDPATHQIFLGEENGTRIYRLERGGDPVPYATGLHRVPAGGALAVDAEGRLLVLDYVDRRLAPGEEPLPRGLEPLRDEGYRGPLVFRVASDPSVALPRRLDRAIPIFPKLGGAPVRGLLGYFAAVATLPAGDVALIEPTGALFRLRPDGAMSPLARLPRGLGEYNRISMVAAPDGSLFVSGGFHVGRVFRVSPAGAVEMVAEGLQDPQGLALDEGSNLYIAESSRHRIVRVPASAR